MRRTLWILGGVAMLIAALIGLTMVSSRGGHESYRPKHFAPGPALGVLKALSAEEMEGRGTGTPGAARAQDLIRDRMSRLGLLPMGEGWFHPFRYGALSSAGPEKAGVNIIGHVKGRAGGGPVMVVSAHYDHLGVKDGETYNGADDNASGVSAMLAIAAYFMKVQPEHDVIFVAFDAEEDGFGGSAAFIADPPVALSRIAFNLNLDMVARADNGILWAVGTAQRPYLKPVVEAAAAQAPITLKAGFDSEDVEGQDDWTTQSDHWLFHQRGIAFVYLGVEDHADYHKPTDDFAAIDQDTFLKCVDSAIMVAIEAEKRLDAIARAEVQDADRSATPE